MTHAFPTMVAALAIGATPSVLPCPGAAPPGAEVVLRGDGMTLLLDETAARRAIATQLVLIGRDPLEADRDAASLTMADIEVLLANPAMMQVAAGAGNIWLMIIFASLLIAGLIVVAASSNGTVMISA